MPDPEKEVRKQADEPSPISGEAAAGEALKSAQQAVEALSAEADAAEGETPRPVDLPDFTEEASAKPAGDIALLAGVNLNVKIELGRTRLLVEDVLRLGVGSVVELDKLAGDPVDVYVNDRHIARGEVLVLNDNFCVRISEVLSPTGQARPAGTRATDPPQPAATAA